jgi:hypothetical protein
MLMKLLVVSLVAVCALMVILAASALASTDSHFPEGVTAGNGCSTVVGTPANGSGSASGAANKTALFTDACAGGP